MYVEICLSGDHGKGSFIFMAFIMIRYKNSNQKIKKLEIKLSKINEEKNNSEYTEILIQKISNGIQKMNVNSSRDYYINLHDFNNITFSKQRENNNQNTIKFYLIGDLKSLFQLVGRSKYDYSYYLYCKYKPKN